MHSPHDDRRPALHLHSVPDFEPVRYPQPFSPESLLCAECAEELREWRSPERPHPLQGLADLVGGLDVLASLDATPLPDEPFAWAEVPGELVPLLESLVPRLDAFADEVLTVEHRTALRRCAAHIANRAPRMLTKKGSLAHRTAAIAWIGLRINDDLGPGSRILTGRDLTAWFGLASDVGPRARTMLTAARGTDRWSRAYRDRTSLAQAKLLTARRRRQIIADRDRRAG